MVNLGRQVAQNKVQRIKATLTIEQHSKDRADDLELQRIEANSVKTPQGLGSYTLGIANYGNHG